MGGVKGACIGGLRFACVWLGVYAWGMRYMSARVRAREGCITPPPSPAPVHLLHRRSTP